MEFRATLTLLKVSTYPPFPGKEKNYLRAQIARIAAGTVISPKGFYISEEDDADLDPSEVSPVQVNPEFEGLDPVDLLSQTNWVHHYPSILNQGRCSYFSLKEREDSDDEDEDKPNQDDTEFGPKILTEISEDHCKYHKVNILILASHQ